MAEEQRTKQPGFDVKFAHDMASDPYPTPEEMARRLGRIGMVGQVRTPPAATQPETFNNRGFGQAFNGQGQSPQYGFTNNYQPSPQAQALGAVLNALQDPRNQWMGTGMAGGTIRGLGGLRNYFADKAAVKAGGFRPTQQEMDTALGYTQYHVPMKDYISDIRGMNKDVARWDSDNPMIRKEAQDRYLGYSQHNQKLLDDTWKGRQQLKQDLNGRSEPPSSMNPYGN